MKVLWGRSLVSAMPVLVFTARISLGQVALWWTPFSGHENRPFLDRGRH
jgi:hypothetical protein